MQNEAIEPGIKEGPVGKQVFKPSSWLTKIDYINHLVLFSNVMIAVLAERASGKTTFISLLQAGLDSNIKSHVIQAKAPFSQAELLTQLSTAFHLKADSDTKLRDLIAQINERKAQILLIIDDAQYLPDTFLQEVLSELKEQGASSFFHLCLVSDHSLSTSLNKMERELIHSLEPGNLTVTETKTYLRHVLPFSKKLDKTMTEKRLDHFYKLTEGNIARINAQMIDYFCFAATTSSDKRKYLIRGLSFAATAAVALIASSYIWQNQFLPSSVDLSSGHEFEESVAEISQPLPSLVPVVPVAERELILLSELPNIHQELIKRPSQIPAWYVAAMRQQVQPSPKRVVDVAIEDESDDSLVVRDRVVVIPKTIAIPPPAQVTETIPEQIAPVPVQQAAAPKAVPKVIDRPFTIQLLASPKQEDIMRFVNNHKIKKTAKIRLTKRDGADWYVLTIGEYNQVEHAQAAIKSLPTELARYNPWVRPVSQLKATG
ncbi:cell division protein DamX [Legionella massiliensis]|uniref:Cell division protein DamX n=1 Tax=Legionella massiliensis TaxID=1034943 RepID=A0A078L0H0_9GAMM|nr:AAA family ATPase [Legionella massiliensis]CDZ78656.1 cell division protein DamX [Legionella massiliensis]CEE14394.1 hypothetical protein BN1094_02968 [Legionella massiliensis]